MRYMHCQSTYAIISILEVDISKSCCVHLYVKVLFHFPIMKLKTSIKHGTKYSRMDQVEFVENRLSKILLGPFVNTLSLMGVCTTFDRNGSISEHFIGVYSFSKVVWTSFQPTIPCVLLKSISTIF